MASRLDDVYPRIVRNLRDFGFEDATVEMVREVHEALDKGQETPYGPAGMFACGQLEAASLSVEEATP
jgi:hypothetical protein